MGTSSRLGPPATDTGTAACGPLRLQHGRGGWPGSERKYHDGEHEEEVHEPLRGLRGRARDAASADRCPDEREPGGRRRTVVVASPLRRWTSGDRSLGGAASLADGLATDGDACRDSSSSIRSPTAVLCLLVPGKPVPAAPARTVSIPAGRSADWAVPPPRLTPPSNGRSSSRYFRSRPFNAR